MNAQARNAYLGQSVATASPAKLLVMLVDRLVLDIERAIAHQEAREWATASGQLIHAQEIVLELRGSLRLDVWDAADQLAGIYSFVHTELVKANIRRDVDLTRGCLRLVKPIAEAWRQAAVTSLTA